jgi:hypothetical protein
LDGERLTHRALEALLPKIEPSEEFLTRLLARLNEDANGEPVDDDIAAVALTKN